MLRQNKALAEICCFYGNFSDYVVIKLLQLLSRHPQFLMDRTPDHLHFKFRKMVLPDVKQSHNPAIPRKGIFGIPFPGDLRSISLVQYGIENGLPDQAWRIFFQPESMISSNSFSPTGRYNFTVSISYLPLPSF